MDRMIIESPGSRKSRYLIDEDNQVVDLLPRDQDPKKEIETEDEHDSKSNESV